MSPTYLRPRQTAALGLLVFCYGINAARAEYFPVLGGPKDGIDWGQLAFLSTNPVRVSNAGAAVGIVGTSDFGARAARWDGAGTQPLVLDSVLYENGQFPARHSSVAAINDAGFAVGRISVDAAVAPPNGATRAFRWGGPENRASILRGLSVDPGVVTSTDASSINAAGMAVGWAARYEASIDGFLTRAVRWDAWSADAVELTVPSEFAARDYYSRALDVNDSGMVIGWVGEIGVRGVRSVRWDASGVPLLLDSIAIDPFDGAPEGSVFAINSAGTAVGNGLKYDESGTFLGSRAIRWDAGGTAATELHGLGSRADGFGGSFAANINDDGDVVGGAQKYDEFGNDLGQRAVRWDSGSVVPIELDHLGYASGYPYAINAGGVAVGGLSPARSPYEKAVYWRRDGTAVDLNTHIDPDSGWTLRFATDISDTGWIVGYGSFAPDGPGYRRMFLLHVPEAAGAASVLVGDFNNNGLVEQADLDLVLLHWGQELADPAAVGWLSDPPVGIVNQQHLDKVLLGWGNSAAGGVGSSIAVPEPTSAVLLLAVGATALLAARRRGRRT